jgi:hypothetical protein
VPMAVPISCWYSALLNSKILYLSTNLRKSIRVSVGTSGFFRVLSAFLTLSIPSNYYFILQNCVNNVRSNFQRLC